MFLYFFLKKYVLNCHESSTFVSIKSIDGKYCIIHCNVLFFVRMMEKCLTSIAGNYDLMS